MLTCLHKNGFLFTSFILLSGLLWVGGCSKPKYHWEQIAEFKNSGHFQIIPENDSRKWVELATSESGWKEPEYKDTTRIKPGETGVAKLSFTLPEQDIEVFAGLFRAKYNLAFDAYLNGKPLVSRKENEFVPDYHYPPGSKSKHSIYAYYRPANFLIDENKINDLIRPGLNEIYVVVKGDDKLDVDDMRNFSFSLGVVSTRTVISNNHPSLSPDDYFEKSKIPVLRIETNGQPIADEPKVDALMEIELNSDTAKYNKIGPLNIGIELRGNTAKLLSKKSFGVNLKDRKYLDNFLGLPTEKKWVFYGPYVDRTLLRNAFAYSLSEKMGNYSTRFRFCELFINDGYQGIYMITEKVEFEDSRITGYRAAKNDSAAKGHEGDFLLEIDRGKKAGWGSKIGHNQRGDIHYFEFEDPRFDDLNSAQREYVMGFIQAFEEDMLKHSDDSSSRVYEDYINPEKFYDYIIINELSKNIDAYRLSTFLVKRGDENGGKLEPGPVWDYNLAFGLANYNSGHDPAGFVFEFYAPNMPFWWSGLMEKEDFKKELQRRYTDLRTTTLHRDSLYSLWSKLEGEVKPATDRNFSKWSVLTQGDFWPNHNENVKNYSDATNYLNDWLSQRLEWLDEQWLLDEPQHIP